LVTCSKPTNLGQKLVYAKVAKLFKFHQFFEFANCACEEAVLDRSLQTLAPNST